MSPIGARGMEVVMSSLLTIVAFVLTLALLQVGGKPA